jgi:hypothetical protein
MRDRVSSPLPSLRRPSGKGKQKTERRSKMLTRPFAGRFVPFSDRLEPGDCDY